MRHVQLKIKKKNVHVHLKEVCPVRHCVSVTILRFQLLPDQNCTEDTPESPFKDRNYTTEITRYSH